MLRPSTSSGTLNPSIPYHTLYVTTTTAVHYAALATNVASTA